MNMEKIGRYAFIAGVIIAIFASVVPSLSATLVTEALVVLGIIVGLINVTEKETQSFLVAAVSMFIVASLAGTGFSQVPIAGAILQKILLGIMTFVTPAVIIVALRQIYGIAKSA